MKQLIIIAILFTSLVGPFGYSNNSNVAINREAAIYGFEQGSDHLVQNSMHFSKDTMVYKVQYLIDFSTYNDGDYLNAAQMHLWSILHEDNDVSTAEFRTQFKKNELKVNVVRLELTSYSGKKYKEEEQISLILPSSAGMEQDIFNGKPLSTSVIYYTSYDDLVDGNASYTMMIEPPAIRIYNDGRNIRIGNKSYHINNFKYKNDEGLESISDASGELNILYGLIGGAFMIQEYEEISGAWRVAGHLFAGNKDLFNKLKKNLTQ